MKAARISLGLATLGLTVLGAFAFRGHSKFVAGTLYTSARNVHVDCSRPVSTQGFCPVTSYTINGTKINKNTSGAYATVE